MSQKSDNKEKIDIGSFMKAFSKEFGEESISRGNDIPSVGEVVPTGSPLLDEAIGSGGIPLGRVVEMFGAESSGKTSLCSSIISQAQKKGLTCAFIDAEATYDRSWAQKIGVDLENLLFIDPTSLEDALDKVTFLIENGVDLIVFDSVAGAPSKSELEGSAGDRNIAEKPRILSQYFRSVVTKMRDHGAAVILINQMRTNVGVMYGNPEVTPGGVGLKYTSTIRLRLAKKPIMGSNKEPVGDKIKIKVVKNKAGIPGRIAETTLYFDSGFDVTPEIVDLAVRHGLIEKTGAWYKPVFLSGEEADKKIQGEDSLIEYLSKELGVIDELEELVRQKIAEAKVIEDDDESIADDPTF